MFTSMPSKLYAVTTMLVCINTSKLHSKHAWSILTIDFNKLKPKGVSKQFFYSIALLDIHNNTCV
jgi:hypothetical protein